MPNTALNRTTQALLTNKSGGSLNYGDVVVLDNTNANGFTTTTTAGLSTRGLGVILEPLGIANNASGMVAVGGWCPQINLNTAAAVGQFIKTHTVAGQGTPHASPQVEGDFAVALSASATPAGNLFGSPNGPLAGGSGTVTHTAGNLTANAIVLGNAVADITVLGSLGTTTTLLHGNAAGAPTFSAVSLTADVTGTLPVANGGTGITAFGTGVATALGINVGSAGGPVTNGGALGTPSSGTATNLTGTASGLTAGTASAVAVGGITGLGTGNATALAINTGTAGSFGAWTKIEEQTPSATGTLTFSSLGSYTHLEIRWVARSDQSAAAVDLGLRFNADTGANYDVELLYNSSATAASAFEILAATSATVGTLAAGTATAGRAGAGTIAINDYRGTTFDKVVNSTDHWAQATTTTNINTRIFGATWRNTAAVTSVTLLLSAGNYVAGSKFTLYGLN